MLFRGYGLLSDHSAEPEKTTYMDMVVAVFALTGLIGPSISRLLRTKTISSSNIVSVQTEEKLAHTPKQNVCGISSVILFL